MIGDEKLFNKMCSLASEKFGTGPLNGAYKTGFEDAIELRKPILIKQDPTTEMILFQKACEDSIAMYKSELDHNVLLLRKHSKQWAERELEFFNEKRSLLLEIDSLREQLGSREGTANE